MLLQRSHVAALLLLLAPCTAQAGDPPTPPGGFKIVEQLDQPMAFSDKYKSCVDIRLPAVAAPRSGWPGVVLCHGSGGSRKSVAGLARILAAAGYATFAHDHRGFGCTPKVNPTAPTTFPGERNLLDFAEVFVVFEQKLTTRLDSDRLAMVGTSMGAGHAYAGAAYSGRTLPLGGWVKSFPRLLAVAGQIGVIDQVANAVPGDRLLRAATADHLRKNATDPRWVAANAARYDVLANLLRRDPINKRGALLRTNDVPVYARVGWEDNKVIPAVTLDALDNMKAGVPAKGLVNGNGHGTPTGTAIEAALYEDDVVRWFDHFLKKRSNGIVQEPKFEAAVTPLDSRYFDRNAEWEHRWSASWPINRGSVFYLRGNGALSPSAPTSPELGRLLRHRVPSAYDLSTFLSTSRGGKNASAVRRAIPLVSHDFAGPALPRSTELFGRPVVEFSLRTSSGDFQISAALLVRDNKNNERFLAGGTTAVRGQKAGIHRVRIELRDIAAVVDAGSKLVLRVENLSNRRTPGQDYIEFVPWLGDVDMGLVIDPNHLAEVHLPIRPVRGIGLTPRLATGSAKAGIAQPVNLDAGPERAGQPYFLFLSTSGFGPGVQYGGTTVPLNIDAITTIGIQLMNSPMLPNFAGKLDANGKASGRIVLPPPVATVLKGERLTVAGIVMDRGTVRAAGPAQLVILP